MSLSYLHIAVPQMARIKTLRDALKARDVALQAGIRMEIHGQYGQQDYAQWSQFNSQLTIGLFFEVGIDGTYSFVNGHRPSMIVDIVLLRRLLDEHARAPDETKVTLKNR